MLKEIVLHSAIYKAYKIKEETHDIKLYGEWLKPYTNKTKICV